MSETGTLIIPMLLFCPMCGARHIDDGEFATKPHHTHACQNMRCGMVWRPAIVATVGVSFLPGFNNAMNKLEAWTHQQEPPPSPHPPGSPTPVPELRLMHSVSITRAAVYDEITVERRAQDAQWGNAQHDDLHKLSHWLRFIAKQVDKATQRRTGERKNHVTPAEHRQRLVKIAALAVAALESFDRKARGKT